MKKDLLLIRNSLIDLCECFASYEEKQQIEKSYQQIFRDIEKNKKVKTEDIDYIEFSLTTCYFENSISTDLKLQHKIIDILKNIRDGNYEKIL